MSVFGNIRDAIFSRGVQAAGGGQPGQGAAMPQFGAAGAPGRPVDVEAVLAQAAASKSETLNYRTSIVDLMKLLDLDSSLANRKALAEELGYTGPRDGSAEMNIWLHQAVMKKLEENGGRVSAELRS